MRALVLMTAALLSGCSCVEYRVIDVDARAKLEDRRRFVVLGTALATTGELSGVRRRITFSDLPAAVLTLEASYGPETRSPEETPWTVSPLDQAPEPLRACLRAAREELLALGYVAATSAEGNEAPDLVVLVSLTHQWVVSMGGGTYEFGEITRAAIHVGGPIDDAFERALVSIDAKPDDEDCEVVAEDLVREMVGALPGPGDEEDAEKLEEKER